MASNNPILLVLVLSYLLSLNVESSIAVAEAPKSPTLEDFCQNTEFPQICVSQTRPYISGHINAYTILDAGLKALDQLTKKAIEDVEKIQHGSKKKEKANELPVCLAYYNIVINSVKKAKAAIPVKDFASLESELDNQVSSIRNCENLIAGTEFGRSSTPMDDINMILKMVAKNNLSMGNNLNNPERP